MSAELNERAGRWIFAAALLVAVAPLARSEPTLASAIAVVGVSVLAVVAMPIPRRRPEVSA